MSEEAKVETPQADDIDPEAIFRELGEAEAGLGDGPPAEDKPEAGKPAEESQEEAPAAESPASEKADDPWKDAPPALREAHEAAVAAERTRADAAETVARRHSGRLSQITLERNDLLAKLTPVADGTATPKGEEATDREERRKQLLEEYGDSAGKLIPDILAHEEEIAGLKAEIAAVKGTQDSQAATATEDLLDEQFKVVEKFDPDWMKTRDDPVFQKSFGAWLEKQPGYIQDAAFANGQKIVDGSAVVDILTRYRADTAEDPAKKALEEKRKEQLEGSRDTRTKAPGTTAQGADDSDVQGIWNELDAKDRRAAAGR